MDLGKTSSAGTPAPSEAAPDAAPAGIHGWPPRDPALRRLLEEYVESRGRENTRIAYRKALGDYLAALEIESAEAFLAVETPDMVQYRNGLQRRGLSNSTINQRLAAVRGVYRRLLKLGRIERNPGDPDLVEGFRVSTESRTEGLTLEEVKKILDTCDATVRGLRDRALLVTLYYQGLRRSEVSKLNWRDLTTRRGLLEIRDAKGGPYETIRLRPEVRQAIEDYHRILNMELARLDTRPEDPVFVSLSTVGEKGVRLAPSSINELVKAHVRAAGIKRRVTCHSWRHSCTTHALAAGAPLHQVQRHLRHKDVRTTLRYDRERDVRKNPTLDLMPSVE